MLLFLHKGLAQDVFSFSSYGRTGACIVYVNGPAAASTVLFNKMTFANADYRSNLACNLPTSFDIRVAFKCRVQCVHLLVLIDWFSDDNQQEAIAICVLSKLY